MLDKSCVQCADCINIRNTNCSWPKWRRSFGYYDLDNAVKYSICQNPHDDCIYAKGAHFSWEKLDPTDLSDLPPNRIKLARDNVVARFC